MELSSNSILFLILDLIYKLQNRCQWLDLISNYKCRPFSLLFIQILEIFNNKTNLVKVLLKLIQIRPSIDFRQTFDHKVADLLQQLLYSQPTQWLHKYQICRPPLLWQHHLYHHSNPYHRLSQFKFNSLKRVQNRSIQIHLLR